MVWIAAAIIGGAALGTIGNIIASGNASSAAQQAANVQAQAANQAAALQFLQYGTTRNDLLAFQNLGRSAIPYVNSLVPGGLSTPNPALPTQPGTVPGQAGATQLSGYDSSGNPVYTQPGGDPNAAPGQTFSGATGGLSATPAGAPGAGSVPAGSQNPFLTSQLSTIPQLGPVTQAGLGSFLPGTGSNPLQSSLYSFVNGASLTPNPVLSASNNAILGASGAPNVALNNLTSFIPGTPNASPTLAGLSASMGQYGALLGLGPSPVALGALQNINDQYNADRKAWLAANPGKTDADWAKTDQFDQYNNKLIDFYKANPNLAAQGANQAQQQLNDPNFAGAAQARLDALKDIKPQTQQQAAQSALEQTPGYQFTLDQGLKATQNSYAAQGLASSGAALKGAAQFATGLADQTYNQQLNNYLQNFNTQLSNYQAQNQNAYNIYNTTANNALNAFGQQSNLALNSYGQGFTNALNAYGQQAEIAGNQYGSQTGLAQNLLTLGANAGAQTGTIGAQTSNNAGNYLTSGAAAQAGGIVGATNALNAGITGGIGNLTGGLTTAALLNRYGIGGVPAATPAANTNPLTVNPAGTAIPGLYGT